MRRLLYILLLFLTLPVVAQEELCMDGTLLFREDFGGNDPSDPAVSSQNVPGMSSQYYNSGNSLGSGHYTVRKEGWSNGIQWHRQDDHTYPNDKTRGYLLEVDGKGGAEPFYSKTIDGICAGSKLTFSAYVVNVHYAGQLDYFGGSYVYPRMKFVLKNPTTGSVLAEKSTGDIQPDWRYGTPETWKYAWDNALSAEWQLIGMNFTVPEGVESIQMYIYNDVARNGSGNDFALDDIEIHLCAPPVTIEGETEVCANKPITLTANLTNDGTFAEPLEYQWWHSTDSITWVEMSDFNGEILAIDAIQKADSGWYRVAVSGDGNIDNINCRAVSEPFRLRVKECESPEPPVEELCIDGILLFREDFGGNDPSDPRVGTNPVPGLSYTQATTDVLGSMGGGKYLVTKQGYCNGNGTSQWHLQDDHTYFGDLTRGYLLEIDGLGDNAAFYSTTIEGLCEGSKLTFSAYVANVMTWGMYIGRPGTYAYPRLKFVLADPVTDAELAMYDTGDIPFDSAFIGDNMCWQQSVEWRLVGMNFTVPAGQNSIKLTIYNNATGSNGNDFAIDDIEIHLCAPPVTIEGETEVCTNSPTTLTANFTNDGAFAEPLEYKWWHSMDSITWSEMAGMTNTLAFKTTQKADSGWYKVSVSGAGNIESVNCRAMSEPFRLRVSECAEELCIDGILLFREDFGGNDPNDPIVGTQQVPGMDYSRYTQRLNADHVTGQPGLFWLIKSGYYHADTTGGRDPMRNHSNWYLQDDHTYPNDKTRGYLLEIDGMGGTAPFYSTVVQGVCPGMRLTFSAYVANVNKASNYIDGIHARVYPKLKFEIEDAKTHTVLGSHSTGDIPYDPDLTVNTDFWYSSKWYLHGMTFTIPEAVDSIRLTIYNDVMNNGAGNDFALDDIEIRLCMTPDTIRTDTTVCDTLSRITWHGKEFAITDTLRDTLRSSCGFDSIYYLMRVETEHCESPCPEIHYATRDTTVCDTLMPFTWHGLLFNKPGSQTILLKDEQGCDSIEIDYTLSTFHCEDFCLEGELLFREDFGGNDAGDSEISCAHVSGIANFYTNACQEVRKHPEYGMSTMNYVLTKKGQGNRQWHVQDDHTYPNDYTRGYFLEVAGYGGTIYKTTVNNLYEGMELTFSSYIANLHDSCVIANMRKNYGYTYPRFKFILKDAESNAELATYTTGNILPDITTPCVLAKSALWQLKGMKYVVPKGVSSIQMLINNDVASYDGNDFGIDDIEIRLCYMPAKKIVQDTIICDTIDNIVWRNNIYPLKNELRDTVYDSSGADSIYYILNVIMEHCCPEIKEKTITIGTICDTLLPYTLYLRDTVLTFKMAGDLLLEFQHPQWDCIDSIYTLHLDTIHCERLYDIIVNKYNWQLLCDNVALRKFFPERMATAFQWYKNEQPISGATDDDYAEQNELCGVFQLNVKLDDGRSIWSNIIEIKAKDEIPIRVQIYNSQGMPVSEEQLSQGVYLFRYERGDEVWIEKKWIP